MYAGAGRSTGVVSGIVVLSAMALPGCSSKEQRTEMAPAAEEAYSIRIDRADNGAAVEERAAEAAGAGPSPRVLSFEMTGFAKPCKDGQPQERRAAALQAAIIDGFCKALIEARRSRGQSDRDFTAEIGPRLTVTHRTLGDGYEVRAVVRSRGVETVLEVRNGILQHAPRDLNLIRKMFDETNGEFSLLGTQWSSPQGEYVATIGCYLPADVQSAVAMEKPAEDSQRVETTP